MVYALLSVCLIVKNEGENLSSCLESVRDVASQIVVVDTGSTDDSVAVARKFGAEVHFFPWTRDFSAARNFSLQKATKEWILVIDADEQLDGASAQTLAQLLKVASVDAFTVRIHNYLGDSDNPELMVGSSVRLFRLDRGFKYRGTVHEDVSASIVEKGGRIDVSDVVLHHYGYLTDVAQKRSRFERNVALLRARVEEDPTDGVAWFYLGTEYFVAQRYQEAIKHYRRALKLVDFHLSMRPRLVRNAIESLRQEGQFDEAYQLVQKATIDYPDYADLWFLRGLIEDQLGQLSEAFRSFKQALATQTPPQYETNVTAVREKTYVAAASVLLKQGRYIESLEYVADCLALNSRVSQAYIIAVQAYVRLGQFEAAEELIRFATQVDPRLEDVLKGVADKLRKIRRHKNNNGGM